MVRHALLLLGFALLLRGTGFFATELHVDESLYTVQAAAWLGGGPPYVGVFDMHPVGMPAVLALAQWAFGIDILVVRLVGVAATTIAALLLMALLLRMGASAPASLLGGLVFVALGVGGTGISVNTHVVFAPLTVGGVLLAFRLVQQARDGAAPSLLAMFTMGVPFGLGMWIKQVVMFPACFAWLAVIGVSAASGLVGPGRVAALAAVYALACGLPSLLTMGTYAASGHLDLFVHANFGALFAYRDVVESVGFSIPHALRAVLLLLWPALFASLLLLVAAPAASAQGSARPVLFLLGWTGAELLAAIAPGHLYDHHFLVLAPPLAAMAALGIDRLAARIAAPGRHAMALAALGAWPIAALSLAAFNALALRPGGLHHPDSNRQIAAVIRATLPAGETIWVPDASPIIHVLTGTMPPTRFVFPAQLTGEYYRVLTGVVDVRAELERIAALRPRFIARLVESDRLNEHAATILPALMEDYVLYGTFGTTQLWQRRG